MSKKKKLSEGNLYNVETSNISKNRSEKDLSNWKKEVRRHLMHHLAGRSSQDIEKIIQATFGDTI